MLFNGGPIWKCPKYEDFPDVCRPCMCERGLTPTLSTCYTCGHKDGYADGIVDGEYDPCENDDYNGEDHD
jgi:hypothetical protein